MNLSNVPAVISDVDGVLTDGRIGLGPGERAIRFFDMRDGLGTKLLIAAGVRVAWLSASRDDGVIRRRAEMLGVKLVDVGSGDKGERLAALCDQLVVSPDDVLYIGDDVNDLPAMALAGFTACPMDARPEVVDAVDIVLGATGGRGAFRELADLLLASRQS